VNPTPKLLATKPVRKWGHSHVISLSREVREVLKIEKGDQITFRQIGRFVVLAVLRPYEIIPISEEERRLQRVALGG
jgi:antitoxin component of MazEF toxin-antitoxin module